MDCFELIRVKEERKELKRYSVMLTCVSSRAGVIATVQEVPLNEWPPYKIMEISTVFSVQGGYSLDPETLWLQNDLHAIASKDWTDVLNIHSPSNPLILIYYTKNERI